MSNASVNTVLRQRLLVLSKGNAGFSVSEVSGFTSKQVGPLAEELVREGTLHRTKVSHKVVRYFATEALASAFASGQLAKPAKASATMSPRTKATWPKDAPMNITADTKITVAPAPPTGIYRTNTHSR